MANTIIGALPNETEEDTKKRLGLVGNVTTSLPYLQENTPLQLNVQPNSLAPTAQNAGGTAYAGIVNAGQTANTLSAAQNNAMNYGSQTLPGVQQMTKTLMQQPTLGFDYGQYKQQQVDQYTKAQTTAMEAAREAAGGTANTGKTQFDTLANQMAFAQNRQGLSNELDIQQRTEERDAYLKALAAGKETVGLEQGQQTAAIQNQIAAGQAGVPWAQLEVGQVESSLNRAASKELAYIDADTKKSLMTLQNQFDTGNLIKEQDFASAQAALDRSAQAALASGDIAAQKDIAKMQAELQVKLQENQQTYAKSERIATQLWQTGERVSEQDFKNAMQLLEQKHEMAVKQGDWNLAQELQDQQLMTQVQMQLTDKQTQRALLYDKQAFDQQNMTLQNKLDQALQSNQTQAAFALQTMVQSNENLRLEKAQEFADYQRIATQTWTTGERISQDQFEQAQKYIQADIDKTNMKIQQGYNLETQAVDFQHAQTLQEQKAILDFNYQLQGFTQEEKMVKLGAELSKAAKEEDFTKQKAILALNFDNDMSKLLSSQGFEKAMQNNQNNFTQNLEIMKQNNVVTNMYQEQKMWEMQNQVTYKQTYEMAMINKAMEDAKLKLQERGLDMSAVQNQYDALIAIGDNQGALNLLKKSLPPDIANQVKLPDKEDVIKNAREDYRLLQYQYSQTHPGSAKYDGNGNFVGLAPQDEKSFNEWMNNTLFATGGSHGTPEQIEWMRQHP